MPLDPRDSPLAKIPNIVGFRFIGVRHNGTLAKCVVEKNEYGAHVVGGEATYADLCQWYPEPRAKERA